MSNDSGLFHTRDELEADGWQLDGNDFVRGGKRMLPLYEAKMIHHFDHQWATYEPDSTVRLVTEGEKADRDFDVMPRYWLTQAAVDGRLTGWTSSHLLGWREVSRSTDERSVIAALIPRVAVGHKYQLALPAEPQHATLLAGVMSSFVFDFVSRQKLGGTAMSYFALKQLPLRPPEAAPVTLSIHVTNLSSTLGGCNVPDERA